MQEKKNGVFNHSMITVIAEADFQSAWNENSGQYFHICGHNELLTLS